MRRRPKYVLFAVIGAMFVYVLTHTERFLIDPGDGEWMHIQSFRWWLLPHAIAGACALILGPLQFSDRLRQRYLALGIVQPFIANQPANLRLLEAKASGAARASAARGR